jgi:hypothetical protein
MWGSNVRKKIGKFGGIVVGFLLFFLLFASISVSADDMQLAQQYAPIFYFEGEETCYPVDVSYHIDNSILSAVGNDQDDTPATDVDLSQFSDEQQFQYLYLDNQKGGIDNDDIIEDYQSKEGLLGYTVYSHVFTDGSSTVIQYWMFYAFNKGELNQHEGDWEMVQVILSGGSPINVMYSQHHSGQKATWEQVEKDGDHIKVYVARGSHANYLRSYSGKVGIANDYVGNNGKVLKPIDYSLTLLESQDWLSFAGRWGEFSNIEDEFLGSAGPQGPMYREDGAMWGGTNWGNNLPQANDKIFLLEWFIYNFITIFILISILSLGILGFRIYRRHKKYGLGPRIISMFYIDGPNLKTIGNILCIVGIIIAICALFGSWYAVSYSVSGDASFATVQTEGMTDLITVDGLSGIQITVPGQNGPTPMGTLNIPFSLLIGIGLIFTILATIGISRSTKIGWKYIWRGLKLLLPIILIIIIFKLIGTLIASMIPDTGSAAVGNAVGGILDKLSSSPLGGQGIVPVSMEGVTGQIGLQWGLGQGGQLLLVAGIILVIAGILEILARTTFFEPKIVEKSKKQKKKEDKERDKKYKKSEENKGIKPDIPKEENNEEEIFDK